MKNSVKPTPTPTKGRVIKEVPNVEASLGLIFPLFVIVVSIVVGLLIFKI